MPTSDQLHMNPLKPTLLYQAQSQSPSVMIEAYTLEIKCGTCSGGPFKGLRSSFEGRCSGSMCVLRCVLSPKWGNCACGPAIQPEPNYWKLLEGPFRTNIDHRYGSSKDTYKRTPNLWKQPCRGRRLSQVRRRTPCPQAAQSRSLGKGGSRPAFLLGF